MLLFDSKMQRMLGVISAFFIGLVVAAAFSLSVGTTTALAAPDSISKFKGDVYFIKYPGENNLEYSCNPAYLGDNVRSTKPKIATVTLDRMEGTTSLVITAKKPGTTRIAYYYKGKKRVAILHVVKYRNPVKTFKVGSKDIAKKFKKSPECFKAYRGPKTVKITPASGWKVKKIYALNTNKDQIRAMKNGSKLKKSEVISSVKLYNKKMKETFYLELVS